AVVTRRRGVASEPRLGSPFAPRVAKPAPLLAEALANRDPGLPTQSLARQVDGGARVAGVARRGRQGLPLHLDAADLFERRDNLVHSGAAPAAEVADLPAELGA